MSISSSLRIALIALLIPFIASAADRQTYQALSGKASRAYEYGEWASASALYGLMIDNRPTETALYGRAIVAAAMRDKPQEEVALLRRAIAAHVAFDSVFASVRRESFAIGQTDLYENFLKEVRTAEPWLKRTVNGYLLSYYTYRRNPRGMIAYSRELLEAVPDNEKFLYILAQGYLLDGNDADAIATWLRITEVNPEAYDALLYMGNYYASLADNDIKARQMAVEYLGRAETLRPTPYVAKKLESLTELSGSAR